MFLSHEEDYERFVVVLSEFVIYVRWYEFYGYMSKFMSGVSLSQWCE